MKRFAKLVLAAMLAFGVLAPMVALAQTTTTVTEEATIEVLRVLSGGQTVIVRNLSTMKVTKYDKIPANATVTIGGKPAKLSDLKQGMRLKGLRIEGVTDTEMSSAEVTTMEATPAPAPAPAPAAAPAPAPAPAPAAAPAPAPAEAPKELPHTASSLPLVAFAGVALLLVGGSLSLRRRIQ